MAARRKTGLKTAGAYESAGAAVQGALERSALTTDAAARYSAQRVVVLRYSAFVALFFAPALSPSAASRKRTVADAPPALGETAGDDRED